MKDDTSSIPNTSGCNVLNSPTQITHYSSDGRSREIYLLVGDKWILQQSNTLNYSYNFSDYNCIDTDTLSSNNVGFVPVYDFIVLILAVSIYFVAFWLLVKPLIWGKNG